MKKETPLVLGTAQFGMDYGVANKAGRPSQCDVDEIVREAFEQGINMFDTAQAYGQSEEVLGQSFDRAKINGLARVVTKLDPKQDHLDLNVIKDSVAGSLKRLNVGRIAVLMLHHESQLDLWRLGLAEIAAKLKQEGLIESFGVSVYSPQRALDALRCDGIDAIQVPANILDRRFENAGVFTLADKLSRRVFLRSIFLQGLILIPPEKLVSEFAFAAVSLKKFRDLCDEIGLQPKELAMVYLKKKYPLSQLVFGVDTLEQLKENIAAWHGVSGDVDVVHIENRLGVAEEKLLNPVLWPKGVRNI